MLRQSKSSRKLSDSHRRAPKQESATATRLGGRVVAGSGCGVEKGDVRIKGLARIECKCTQHKSFSLSRKLINKIEAEALECGEVPIMTIEFLTGEHVDNEVAVLPMWALQSLINNQRED